MWINNLSLLSSLRNLSHVVIDVARLCCGLSCCRTTRLLCGVLENITFKQDLRIEVSGQLYVGENAAIAKAIEHASGIVPLYEDTAALPLPFTTSVFDNDMEQEDDISGL